MAIAEPSNVTMNLPRRDARDKLLGRTRYTVDRMLPRMLHAAILRSEVASARILKIDITRARRMPAFLAIIWKNGSRSAYLRRACSTAGTVMTRAWQ